MFLFGRIYGNERRWIFLQGETKVIQDYIPEGVVPVNVITPEQLEMMKRWEIEDKEILDYDVSLIPRSGYNVKYTSDMLQTVADLDYFEGDVTNYQHEFTALKPGKTFAFCKDTKNRIPITVYHRIYPDFLYYFLGRKLLMR